MNEQLRIILETYAAARIFTILLVSRHAAFLLTVSLSCPLPTLDSTVTAFIAPMSVMCKA